MFGYFVLEVWICYKLISVLEAARKASLNKHPSTP